MLIGVRRRFKQIFPKALFCPVIFFFLLSGCTSGSKEVIRVSGSTTVLPVVSKASEAFLLNNPGVRIIVNAGGSGVGVNQLGEKVIDIGMISREITDSEKKKFPKTHFVKHLIGKDAVAAALSSEVYDSGVHSLSLKDIRNIYLGKILNWKDLGGFDRDILAIDKEKTRGTRHVFMKAVFGDKHAEAPGADILSGSNNEEQMALIQNDAAIGMLSLAWLNKDVKGAGIKINGSVIEPSKKSINNGSYPISRGLYIITDGEPGGTLKSFIDFILSPEGQKIVEESGYVGIL